MRALIVYSHPSPTSFNAAVLEKVTERLRAAGAEYEIIDLYRSGFEPVLTQSEWEGYLDCPRNVDPVLDHVEQLRRCDTLIFVYPTWWYGLPAMLKGWLDRVLLPDVAFHMPCPEHANIRPALGHIRRLGVFTTCGAGWWLTRVIGAPGRRTLMRGVGFLCAKPLKRVFAAHYLMDSSTDDSRRKHLDRVGKATDQLIGAGGRAERRREAVA